MKGKSSGKKPVPVKGTGGSIPKDASMGIKGSTGSAGRAKPPGLGKKSTKKSNP